MSDRNSFLQDPTKTTPPRQICALCGKRIRSSPFHTYPVTEFANKRFRRFAHAVCVEGGTQEDDRECI